MLDHFEVVHCRWPWQGTQAPNVERTGRSLTEADLRLRATQHLQHYIDTCTVSEVVCDLSLLTLAINSHQEMSSVMSLARSVQPVSHWEEHVTSMEFDDSDGPSHMGEVN